MPLDQLDRAWREACAKFWPFSSAAGVPTHQLNWHYRSRDEALIAFSNHHYYDDRLVTFPSPKTETDALSFHRINGVYARGSGRTNEIEARAVVALRPANE